MINGLMVAVKGVQRGVAKIYGGPRVGLSSTDRGLGLWPLHSGHGILCFLCLTTLKRAQKRGSKRLKSQLLAYTIYLGVCMVNRGCITAGVIPHPVVVFVCE